MYGETLEQTSVVRFLGVWMDSKLNFRVHIQNIIDKCKKVINIMRCLAGAEWGAYRQSLKSIYMALIGATIDYGSIVYSSASKTQLARIETIQNQALRICCGAMRSSPVSSLNVEMGVMPLGMRRIKLRMRYWANIKGQSENHPVKNVLRDCWEYNYKNLTSFGWIINEEAREIVKEINITNCVFLPAIPPWFLPMPSIDIQLHKDKHNEKIILDSVKVQEYKSIHIIYIIVPSRYILMAQRIHILEKHLQQYLYHNLELTF